MSELVAGFVNDESGATAIEYGLIVGLIALAIMVSASRVGNAVNDEFELISTHLNASAP